MLPRIRKRRKAEEKKNGERKGRMKKGRKESESTRAT